VRVERIGEATLYLADCREVLPTLARVGAVVTDPPYGIEDKWNRNFSCGGTLWNGVEGWDKETAPKELAAALAVSDGRAIVWGGHYYTLPPSRGYLVWDKMQTGFSLADSELAWCSDPITPRTFRYARAQLANQETKLHPTQKPLPLMKWCLEFLPRAQTILDPFMGSGTTGVAAVKLGRRFIGIEREPKYFEIAVRRIEAAYAQPDLFVKSPEPKPEQLSLLGAAE
jgi:DNA modification methylase